jgi:hypothetical protein
MAQSDLFAALDARIATARAEYDRARTELDRHEPAALRLFEAIREHRDLQLILDPNSPDEIYADRLVRSGE